MPAQTSLTSFNPVNQAATMSSVDMVEYINSQRKKGEPELLHKNFLAKVLQVLGEETSAIFLADLPDSYGRSRRGYRFPKREACLMAMSYSYDLQAKVFDRMTALEAKLATTQATALPSPTSQARQVIEDDLHIANLLNVPLHYAQSESVKHARLLTGVDYSNLLAYAPAQNDIQYEQVMLEPTELGRVLGLSGVSMNRKLEQLGLQTREGTDWVPTEAAKGAWARHQWSSGGKTGYNLKWNRAFVEKRVSAA